MRNRTIPVNTNTTSQRNARNNLAAAARAWGGLTPVQRLAWATAAASLTLVDRLGRPYHPTGFQYFVSVNRTTFVYSGLGTVIVAPPASAIPAALASVTATPDSGTVTFAVAYTATPLAANTKLLIECTQQLGPGVSFVKPSLYRQIFVTAAAAASPSAIYTAYSNKFGGLIAGKKIGLRLTVITSDGNRSTPVTTLVGVA